MVEITRPLGRPRSEDARLAVLRAVDDMLVEEGYAAMTMKGIAERARVGRQTVYRWWSSKAEILLEASAADAARELTVPPGPDIETEITEFLVALAAFLTDSDAGLAYRALVGEAQHDQKVAELLRGTDVLGDAARSVLRRSEWRAVARPEEDASVAELVGPVLYRILTADWRADRDSLRTMAKRYLVREGSADAT